MIDACGVFVPESDQLGKGFAPFVRQRIVLAGAAVCGRRYDAAADQAGVLQPVEDRVDCPFLGVTPYGGSVRVQLGDDLIAVRFTPGDQAQKDHFQRALLELLHVLAVHRHPPSYYVMLISCTKYTGIRFVCQALLRKTRRRAYKKGTPFASACSFRAAAALRTDGQAGKYKILSKF